ncbi:MAG: methyl-accepting chemotaxis protein [Sphingomonadaceae bacterium]
MGRIRGIFSRSLRNSLVPLCLVTALVPLALATVVSYRSFESALRSQVYERLSGTAEQQAALISEHLNQRVRSMMVLGTGALLNKAVAEQAKGSMEDATRKNAIDQLKGEHLLQIGEYENVFLVGIDGKVFLDALDGKLLGQDFSNWDFFKPAIEGQLFVGEPKPSPVTKQLISVVAVPMKDEAGRVQAILGGALDYGLISAKLQQINAGEHSYAFVVDRAGTIVASTDSTHALSTGLTEHQVPELAAIGKRMVSGETGAGSYQLDGSGRLIGFAPVKPDGDYKGQGMAVGVAALEAEFMAPARGLLIGMAPLAAVLLVLVLIMAWFVARRVAEPLEALTDVARHTAEGDVTYHADEKKWKKTVRQDEIGQIGLAFRGIREYLKRASRQAEAIAGGDLTVEVHPCSERDLLGNAFAQMVSGLREAIGQVADVANGVAEAGEALSSASSQAGAATHQIAQTIQEVARGNQEQSGSVQEAASSLDQLSRAIDLIADTSRGQVDAVGKASGSVAQLNDSISRVAAASREVAEATQQAQRAALSGAKAVEKTVDGIAVIKQRTIASTQEVQDLDKYSEQINSIVETIDDIAEQTNLLALNAAIEAARAGEHGRGFAVVAEEVRKLAERTSRSTREIAELIGQVQKETQEAVMAIQEGMKEVEAGTALAEEAGAALKDILSLVESAATQVSQIASAVGQMEDASRHVVQVMNGVSTAADTSATATQEMVVSSQQVTSTVERVAAVSEETSASAEEVSAAAEEMSAQVQEMVAQAQHLTAMAAQLQGAIAHFRMSQEKGVVFRQRQDDWTAPVRPEPLAGARASAVPAV